MKTKSYKEDSQITCHIAIWLEEPTSEPMTLATVENGLLEASKSACTLPVCMKIEKWFVRERESLVWKDKKSYWSNWEEERMGESETSRFGGFGVGGISVSAANYLLCDSVAGNRVEGI